MEPLKVPPSKEVAAGDKESVDAAPQKGNVMEAYPVVDAGHDSGVGHWEGEGQDVKFVKA